MRSEFTLEQVDRKWTAIISSLKSSEWQNKFMKFLKKITFRIKTMISISLHPTFLPLAWHTSVTKWIYMFLKFSSRGSAISAIFTETDQGNLEENWTLMMDSVCSCVKFIFMELKSMKKCYVLPSGILRFYFGFSLGLLQSCTRCEFWKNLLVFNTIPPGWFTVCVCYTQARPLSHLFMVSSSWVSSAFATCPPQLLHHTFRSLYISRCVPLCTTLCAPLLFNPCISPVFPSVFRLDFRRSLASGLPSSPKRNFGRGARAPFPKSGW